MTWRQSQTAGRNSRLTISMLITWKDRFLGALYASLVSSTKRATETKKEM